uniref:Uncharacterized protein n=1 Tax=Zea mays TaxID=4577 RepID=C4IYY3_MAIZE|nr:unknown [Zea mays]|eukprot:NP_001170589.1 uncharacterized protein LOC100384622 [Zea mays]
MMIGLRTSCMSACSKTTPRTYAPSTLARAHVLIRRRSPLSVATKAAPVTVTFSTPLSSLSFPRLHPYAYAMARAAADVLHAQVGGAGANGDAVVVPGPDAGPGDRDLGRGLHVDPVRVGAAPRRDDLHVLHRDAFAALDHDVVQLALDRGQAADHHVPRVQHLQRCCSAGAAAVLSSLLARPQATAPRRGRRRCRPTQ